VNVLERSVFGRVPGVGRWRSALLFDGNIGIGGDPTALLLRIGELLTPDGRIIVELEPEDSRAEVVLVRAETRHHVGPWFRWTTVGPGRLRRIADDAGFVVVDEWDAEERCFARLDVRCR
jgi:hypothetical protein